MSTTPTSSQPSADPRPRASGTWSVAARVTAIVAIVLGGVVAVGAASSAAATTAVHAAASGGSSLNAALPVDGVTGLDADLTAGALTVRFADVDGARLQATGRDPGGWTLRRDGDELVVASPKPPAAGWSWFWNSTRDDTARAALTLPKSLQDLDADFDVAAGELTAAGDFGTLEVTVRAGHATVTGSADDADIEVSAGRADLTLAGVRTGEFHVRAGEADTTLTGTPPRTLDLSASVGALRMTVPAGDYDITSHASAGRFDDRIGSTPGAASTVTVDASVGSVLLRAAR